MLNIDRKGFILGTFLGLMLGIAVVNGYNEIQFMFSCSVIVSEDVNVEILGITPTKGFYGLSFDNLRNNNTKSVTIRNNGESNVILTWKPIDLPNNLELSIKTSETNNGGSTNITEWKESTIYFLHGNTTSNLYITLSNTGADIGPHNFYIDLQCLNELGDN